MSFDRAENLKYWRKRFQIDLSPTKVSIGIENRTSPPLSSSGFGPEFSLMKSQNDLAALEGFIPSE
jgi:hypothetical protein